MTDAREDRLARAANDMVCKPVEQNGPRAMESMRTTLPVLHLRLVAARV
jgi:hypothetical protein